MTPEQRKTARTPDRELALNGATARILEHAERAQRGQCSCHECQREAEALERTNANQPLLVYGQGPYRHDGNGRLIDKEA